MNQKTKSKLFSAIFIIICLLICAASLAFFFYDLNKITLKEEPQVAFIQFKQKIVQRRFSDSVVWERLVQNSPLYNEDLVSTSVGSEAIISFNSGTNIFMDENTMIHILERKPGNLKLNVENGRIDIDTTSAIKPITVEVESGHKIELDVGSKLSTFATQDEADFVIHQGSAKSISKDGESETVFEGESITIDVVGNAQKNVLDTEEYAFNEKIYAVSEILNGAVSETTGTDLVAQEKQQNGATGTDLVAQTVDVPKTTDASLATTTESARSATKAAQPGTTVPKTTTTAAQTATTHPTTTSAQVAPVEPTTPTILPLEKPKLLEPANNFIITADYLGRNRKIIFVWQQVKDATEYQFTLYKKNPNGRLIHVYTKNLTNTRFDFTELPLLDVGKFQWEIKPIQADANDVIVNEGPSISSDFEIMFELPTEVGTMDQGEIYET